MPAIIGHITENHFGYVANRSTSSFNSEITPWNQVRADVGNALAVPFFIEEFVEFRLRAIGAEAV